MRIVELVNTLEFGGTERLVCDLSHALKARGHQMTVVCLREAGPLRDGLARAGIEVIALEKAEGPSLGTVGALRRVLRDGSADVIHSHNPLVHHYAVAAGLLAGTRVVVSTIHGIDNLSRSKGKKEILYALMCRLSASVVAVCPMAFRHFRDGGVVPKSKLTVINNGIPLAPYLRVQRRAAGDEFRFGIVGRLVPVKDHRTLLEAFRIVVASAPQCRLEILGDGPLRAELESRAAQLGIAAQVRFRGFSNEVAAFLESIDTNVLCSKSEGLPLSVLEAMAAGLPVVGTEVGGLPDLIKDGRCGWLSPPQDPRALAAAMLSAVATPAAERAAMGDRAREHARACYSIDQMADGYERLFQSRP